jgi:hypothetical protein
MDFVAFKHQLEMQSNDGLKLLVLTQVKVKRTKPGQETVDIYRIVP